MKTVQDYLSDPRLLNDPDMAGAERIEFFNREAENFPSPMGKVLCYDLAGKGKLEPVTQ